MSKYLLVFLSLFYISCGGSSDSNTPETVVPAPPVYLYETSAVFKGSQVGNRTTTTNRCQSDYAAYASDINCSHFLALLGYSEDNGILEIETNYNINFDSEVFDVSKTIIATSLYNLINEPPPLMSGRPGLSVDRAWSGFENGGNLDDNCVDWVTTNGFASVAEDFNGLDRDWSMTGLGCTTHDRRHLCLCW